MRKIIINITLKILKKTAEFLSRVCEQPTVNEHKKSTPYGMLRFLSVFSSAWIRFYINKKALKNYVHIIMKGKTINNNKRNNYAVCSQPCTLAGTPYAFVKGGILLTTILCPPITAPCPMRACCRVATPMPTSTHSST